MSTPVEHQLGQLPALEPPADAWNRVRKRARHERRITRWRQLWPVLLAGGLTATVAALLLTIYGVTGGEAESVMPPADSLLVQVPAPEVQRLQGQSRELEAMLRDLPGRPQLVRMDNEAAIAALEDRIAEVDWALSRSRPGAPGAMSQPVLWRERVELMGELVRARYTEAGVAAY